jgi:putative endonuclease
LAAKLKGSYPSHLQFVEKLEKPSNQITGQMGEDIASAYLEHQGYRIIHRNWRTGKCEVDIIACLQETLHFIEVKTRSNKGYGLPESKVNAAKLKQLKLAAEVFLHSNPNWKQIQFDIVSINLTNNTAPEIFLIADVF